MSAFWSGHVGAVGGALWSGHAGGAPRCFCQSCVLLWSRCCCRVPLQVPLQGAAVKVMCALWSWRAGAVQGVAAKCCFRVLLLECHLVLWSWPARAAARCRFRVRASGTTVEGLSAS